MVRPRPRTFLCVFVQVKQDLEVLRTNPQNFKFWMCFNNFNRPDSATLVTWCGIKPGPLIAALPWPGFFTPLNRPVIVIVIGRHHPRHRHIRKHNCHGCPLETTEKVWVCCCNWMKKQTALYICAQNEGTRRENNNNDDNARGGTTNTSTRLTARSMVIRQWGSISSYNAMGGLHWISLMGM